MNNSRNTQIIDLTEIDASKFKRQCTGCIVLTHDNRILLQRRPNDWQTFPGMIATFGGGVEANESPLFAIIRELAEELGAQAEPNNLVYLGTITEQMTNHTELVHLYFWFDKHSTITGCYEGEAQFFDSIDDAFAHPKLMDDVKWALLECQARELLR